MGHGQRRNKRAKRWKRNAYILIVGTAVVAVAWLLAPAARGTGPAPPGGQVVDIDGTMGGFSAISSSTT
jgi:hypothetical protein